MIKFDLTVKTEHVLIVGAGIAALFIAKSLASNAANAAGAVGRSVNPASHDNLINRAVNGLGSILSGNEQFTVGGAIYDALHGDEINKATSGND